MRVLFVGDVVGRPGRSAALGLIPRLRKSLRVDAVVVNCENSAAGRGVTPAIADEFLAGGADLLTGGNHVWRYREIVPYLESEPRLLRPANYPQAPGVGAYVLSLDGGRRLGVIHVEGRAFMRNLECPFAAIKREMGKFSKVNAILVEVHAEATSEKQAIAWHFDGRVSAVVGTHTHVPTADERILPKGTAFLTDACMTGPYDSVIGMEVGAAIERMTTHRPVQHQVATENVMLCGCVIEVDDETGKAVSIERVKEAWHD